MKAAMVLFPGSNCEQETLAYLRHAYGAKNVRAVWHRDRFDHAAYDLVFLPGGFSYGDYVRAGACGARSAAMSDVMRLAKRGAFVIGICNGFQILLECGLLPGILIQNTARHFDCRFLGVQANIESRLQWKLPADTGMTLPVANTFGRYYLPKGVHLKDSSQIALRYTGDDDISGSLDRIAGLTNASGNILGMMPHPERAWAPWHHSQDSRFFLPNAGEVTWH